MFQFSHDYVFMSEYSSDQCESSKIKQDHGLSSKGIIVFYHDVLLVKHIFIFLKIC
jgi:hypothetical protein